MYLLVLTENTISSSFISRGLKYENIISDPRSFYENWDNPYELNKFDGIIIKEPNLNKNLSYDLIKRVNSLNCRCILFVISDNKKTSMFNNVTSCPIYIYENNISVKELGYEIKNEIAKVSVGTEETILNVADLKLDLNTREVTRFGETNYLRNKEFHLLEYLMRNTDTVLTRQNLLESVWDRNANMFTNTIDVHINCIRRKVDYKPNSKLIETVYCTGYIMHSKTK